MSSKPPTSGQSILRREAVGFALMLVLIWVVEIFGIPHLFFAEPSGFIWTRVLFRTGIVLVIWAWVHFTTRLQLKRLHELEEFLLVCSWCRKIGHEGSWLTREDYFDSHLRTGTSHGICPESHARQMKTHPTAPGENPVGDHSRPRLSVD